MSSLKNTFAKLLDYRDYLDIHKFNLKLFRNSSTNLDFSEANHSQLAQKVSKTIWQSVDAKLNEPFAAEMDDLIRLHFLATSRKATTILEFGVGKSTAVFDHALEENNIKYGEEITSQLRRSHPFQLHSIDNNRKWISRVRKDFELSRTTIHYSKCRMSLLNGRVCTIYDSLPNISPDLIYLDAPDQFSPIGSINGISTRQPDRLPMAGDLITIEHFLLPGTLVVVDGRTANTRFLLSNFQRRWSHYYFEEYDVHLLELQEAPLGIFNRRQLEICLGDRFLEWGR